LIVPALRLAALTLPVIVVMPIPEPSMSTQERMASDVPPMS
jgi:hypothetical protein